MEGPRAESMEHSVLGTRNEAIGIQKSVVRGPLSVVQSVQIVEVVQNVKIVKIVKTQVARRQ